MTDWKRWTAAAAATAFVIVSALAGLGSYPLIDPDESRYAQSVLEMAARGDYVVPYLDGAPRINKPPLLYWLIAGSYRAFGENEFAARFPSAAAGILMVAVTYLLARSMYGAMAGAFAAGALMSMAVFAAVARLATIDCLMSALLTLALYLWWRFASQGKRRFLAGSWAVLGLAFLAKGPVAVVLFVLVLAADAVAAGRWSKALRPSASAGLLVFAAIAIPWPIAIIAQVPGACEVWWAETVGRFIAGADHSGSLWFPAAMTAAGAFPWYLMPLASMGRPGDWLRTWREDGRARFLAVWCIVVLVFFTACRSQLATYVLPGFAPIAVAAGGALAAAGAGRASRRALLLTACAAGTMGAALVGYGAVRGHFAAAPAAALGTALAAATAAFLLLYARRRYRAAAAVLTATVAVTVVCMTPWVLGMVAARRSFADAARAWGPALRDADMVLFAGEIRHSVPFYSRAVVRQVGSCEEAALALASPKQVAVLMREDVFEEAGPPLARFGRKARRHTVGRKPYLLLTNFDAEGAVAEGQTGP